MISLIQTAEGALNETHSILQRMRELAVQSSNDTNTQSDRQELQKEVNQLANALNDISTNTEFNTQNLLDGTFEGTFHVGANSGQNLEVTIGNMSANSLKVGGVEGASFEVTSSTPAGDGILPEGEYTVLELDEGTESMGGTAVTHALQDADGNIAAVSEDGLTYTALATAVDPKEISDGVAGTTTPNIVFEDTVTSGSVSVAADGVATATATISTDLADGTYTVVGDTHAGVDSGYGLVNDSGDLVALSSDGADWSSYADSGSLVLEATTTITSGTITVGSGEGINISTQKSADAAITTIQSAIDNVSAQRSELGAVQNRLEHTINNLGTSAENLTAAESRIRDVDYTEAA